jgi:hypothetical protein
MPGKLLHLRVGALAAFVYKPRPWIPRPMLVPDEAELSKELRASSEMFQ